MIFNVEEMFNSQIKHFNSKSNCFICSSEGDRVLIPLKLLYFAVLWHTFVSYNNYMIKTLEPCIGFQVFTWAHVPLRRASPEGLPVIPSGVSNLAN